MKKEDKKKGLTKAQIALYWRAFAAACSELGIRSRKECEEYRKKAMLEATGKGSIKELKRAADFDAVLGRFYADAGDFQKAAETAVQDAKRLGFLIKVLCIQLMQLKGGDETAARGYLGGLFDQARLSHGRTLDNDGYWLDLSFTNARKVFSMLDTHRRRLLRQWRGSSSFSACLSYRIDGPILVRQAVGEGYYDSIPFAVNLTR